MARGNSRTVGKLVGKGRGKGQQAPGPTYSLAEIEKKDNSTTSDSSSSEDEGSRSEDGILDVVGERVVAMKDKVEDSVGYVKENSSEFVKSHQRELLTYLGLVNGTVILGCSIGYALTTHQWGLLSKMGVLVGMSMAGISSLYFWDKEDMLPFVSSTDDTNN